MPAPDDETRPASAAGSLAAAEARDARSAAGLGAKADREAPAEPAAAPDGVRPDSRLAPEAVVFEAALARPRHMRGRLCQSPPGTGQNDPCSESEMIWRVLDERR